MKKTISILIITMFVLLISITPTFATTMFNIGLSATSTSVGQGENVDVTIRLKDFTPNEKGVNAIRVTIDYDKTIFDTLSDANITSKSGWSTPTFNPANGKLALDNQAFMAEDNDMVTIRFHVKSTAELGKTTITIKDIDAADSISDIYPQAQEISLLITKASSDQPISFAVDLSATSATVEQGGDVQVTVRLNEFTPDKTGINAIMFTIDYDKTTFDTLSASDFTAMNGWSAPTFNPANGQIAFSNPSYMSEDHDLVTIKFHVKDTAFLGLKTITIRDVEAADGINDTYPPGQSLSLYVVSNSTNMNSTDELSSITGAGSSDNQSNSLTTCNIVMGLLIVVVIVLEVVIIFMIKRKK